MAKLDKSEKTCEQLLKEKDFLQYRVERLEGQIGQPEKIVIREEIHRDADADHRIRHLIAENDRLKEDLMGRYYLIISS